MSADSFTTVGVAPLRPDSPSFATPLFRVPRSNALWYQSIGERGLVNDFGEVAEPALSRVRVIPDSIVRHVGAPALYGFVGTESVLIGERQALVEPLRREFAAVPNRPHLRHAIAKFIGDQSLVEMARDDIAAKWRNYEDDGLGDGPRIFLSYNRSDYEIVSQFNRHLKPVVRAYGTEVWYDAKLVAGDRWEPVIQRRISECNVFILMVSPEYLASDYIMNFELPAIEARVRRSSAIVLPVMLADCLWETHNWFMSLQMIPTDQFGRIMPIDQWQRPEGGLSKTARHIWEAVSKQYPIRRSAEAYNSSPPSP